MKHKKIKDIIQNESSECGLACVSYISMMYGKELPLASLREEYDVGLEGLSFFQLMKIFSHNQMIATGVSVRAEHLRELHKPAILLWNNCHFVVLKNVRKDTIEVMDPAVGSRIFTDKEVETFFSGVALEVILSDDFVPTGEVRKNEKALSYGFRTFYRGIFEYKSYILPLALLSIMIHVTGIAIPKFVSLVFDEVIPKNDDEFLSLLLYIFGLIYLINIFCNYLKIILSQRLRRNISQIKGLSVIRDLFQMNIRFYQKRQPSDLLRKVKAIDAYPIIYTNGWLDIMIDSAFTFILVGLLFMASFNLAVMTVGIITLIVLVRIVLLPAIMSRQYSVIDAEISRDARLLNAVNSIGSIKINNSEYKNVDGWFSEHAQLEYNRSSIEKLHSILELSINTISHLQMMVILGYGAYSVLNGNISAGQLISFIFYKNIIMANIQSIVDNHLRIKLASVEVRRLDGLKPESSADRTQFKSVLNQKVEKIQSLRLENISFTYSKLEDPVITNLSFELSKGSKVALTGPSGSGKTTVLNILSGLLKPSDGCILVNNINLQRFGIRQYQSQISIVSTDDKIISGTVTENIIYDSDLYDIHLLENCIKHADLEGVIRSLNAGLNTRLGYNGTRLSSGQQQRLMFARALYRQPEIMLLDEPTSHLDKESRDVIIEMILALPIACVVVTHDQYLIEKLDYKVRLTGVA
ncbi:peptidase domain-containing ABC transporter [Serratia ureilytica]|uniref:peptidase domain-containing ABC transporter n=1 Tax=Serratia ureilytica TaxID=300181 RepID=UPI001AA13C57|nr:peptidase domain-containing ABC transporter [Serratia ureilytica]MBO1811263.1 peptidase domain-containing ABC transporter [Serratia ureilytica]